MKSSEKVETTEKGFKRNNGTLGSFFCSKSVFNLSKKVLTQTEIHILERGLGFSPSPTKINETYLTGEFNEFSKKIRCKWFFRNEPTANFREELAFFIKSNHNPPNGHTGTEDFKLEK